RDFHVTGVQTCALPICGLEDRRLHRLDQNLSVDALFLRDLIDDRAEPFDVTRCLRHVSPVRSLWPPSLWPAAGCAPARRRSAVEARKSAVEGERVAVGW